ncbi:hypothetical protein C4E24_03300, partial [ANME-1 cluster archaeon AG-394-G21]|nr:hypothetical protein [ANME-1 cluster archaeon AG-394-G21]
MKAKGREYKVPYTKSSRMNSIKKKPFALALFLLLAAALLLAFLPQPALAATPITTCTELQNIRNDLAGDYYLANDIDCSGFDYAGDNKGFMPIGNKSNRFNGTFDGKGYKITNLYINRPSTNYVGLFGFTGSGSEIKDVGLEEVDVHGNDEVGGLVGYNGGPITNSYSSGSVTGEGFVGGLVGANTGTITNSYSSGSVTGSSNCVGGLVGYNNGLIANSYSSGSVTGSSNYVGGLVGGNDNGPITNSYSSGSVTGSSDVGGLVGANTGPITNSYSSGSVTGKGFVGGLVGGNTGPIANSYWDTETSGQSSSGGGTGKTTAEMKQQATFSGWKFDTIWGIVEGVTYPYLQWQFWINCTCGDICVNETGWWRDGSVFIASNTPIQDAIENAAAGETICVKDGTYNENVDVNKSLTIRSENGAASTTVQASNSNDPVFEVTADYVNISGFTVTGATGTSTAGIYLGSSIDHCNISDNNAYNNSYGIFL